MPRARTTRTPTPTKADIERELKLLKETHAQFRKDVAATAREYAEREGWCSEVDEALRQLKLDDVMGTTKRRVTLTVTAEIDAEEYGWDDDSYVNQAREEIFTSYAYNDSYKVIDSKVEEVPVS